MTAQNSCLPVGIFDSGLGGLTALREVRRVLPREDIVYFGDTGRVPYGSRSHKTICKYALQDMRFLLTHEVKAVAVACGTVSANALGLLEETFDVPVIGVIAPAVEKALSVTKNGRVGVIATASTIASGAYEKALLQKAPDLQIISCACPLFVPLVEYGFTDPDDPIPYLAAERYLAEILHSGADTLILGCTHYPLLIPILKKLLPQVTLIDTGAEIAHALGGLLSENGMLSEKKAGDVRYYVSDETQGFAAMASRFLGGETDAELLSSVRRIDIEMY